MIGLNLLASVFWCRLHVWIHRPTDTCRSRINRIRDGITEVFCRDRGRK